MATLSWRCPVCGDIQDEEGTCRVHLVPLVAVIPTDEAATPRRQFVFDTPWGQIDLPPGEVEIGRATPAMAGPGARRFDQVSRRHIRITRQENDEFLIEDLHSLNGTYLDGTELPPGRPHVLRVGQQIRLGLDLAGEQNAECRLCELDEFGVPRSSTPPEGTS